MKTVIRHLRRAALLHQRDGPSDSQLLESFLSRREDDAFEALMRRHGPMVFGVCRRVLRNAHDAEDAFQATFLVLVRKSGALRSRELLANWLYGVAYRTAMKARAMNAKRRAKEKHAGALPHPASSSDVANEELLAQLDHELSRLPDKYRIPVVLCELQGKSRKEAARQMGLNEGTLSWRLAQAKKILAKRLSRQGAALSVGAVAVALTEGSVMAGLSPALRASTLKTVLSAGTVPAKVLTLTEGVLKAMLLSKLKITVCFAALAIGVGVGASGLTYRATAEEPKPTGYYPPSRALVEKSRPQADDLDALRLEIEALRKELRATKERLKGLEDEIRGSKARWRKDAETTSEAPRDSSARPAETGRRTDTSSARPVEKVLAVPARERMKYWVTKEKAGGPISDALEALKRLQADPNDKQAAQTVERALKWLQEREKERTTTGEKK